MNEEARYFDRQLMAYRRLLEAGHADQAELAKRLNEEDAKLFPDEPRKPVAATTIGRWLFGGKRPEWRNLVCWAAVLGVDPGWLDYGRFSAAPAPQFREEAAAKPRPRMEDEDLAPSARPLRRVAGAPPHKRGGGKRR